MIELVHCHECKEKTKNINSINVHTINNREFYYNVSNVKVNLLKLLSQRTEKHQNKISELQQKNFTNLIYDDDFQKGEKNFRY